MKYRFLLPLLALVLAGCDDMLIGLDLGAAYSDYRQPIVDSYTVACGDMLRDRLYFVDETYREAWPVRNSRLDPEATVPAVDRVEVYIEDPRGAPVALCNLDGTVSEGNVAVRMRPLSTATFGALRIRSSEGIVELPAELPKHLALGLAWNGFTSAGTAGLGRGAFGAVAGDTLLLVRRVLGDGRVIAPLELLNVYDLGLRRDLNYRATVTLTWAGDDSRCHAGLPLTTLFYLEPPNRVYPLCEAARSETQFLDEQGWLWFPSLEPFSAGADARPHRSGTGTGAGAQLVNTPHAGYLVPPDVDELGLLYTLRPRDPGYLQLSRAYRIEVLM